jgi:endoglucanase
MIVFRHNPFVSRALLGVLFLIACSDVTSPEEARNKGTTPSGPETEPPLSPAPPIPVGSNPIAGATFWVSPNSRAQDQANEWRESRPADAAQIDKIARNPHSGWFGDWSANVESAVDSYVTTAAASGAVPVLVAYNIPQRDCGGLSGGGGASAAAYRGWISAFARGLRGRSAVVILEPDAVANWSCLSSGDQATRISLMQHAVAALKAQGKTVVYIDGGNPRWLSANEQATRLKAVNIAGADGFALNVSNFYASDENISYGSKVSALVGGKHFVIDTSRNGLGPSPDRQWCNPDGRALGTPATTETGNSLVDAFLWVKTPGQSDGACNGAPAAGEWWPEYALGLAQRSAL